MNELHKTTEGEMTEIPNYINHIFDTFFELRGDRKSGDDDMVVGGLARIDGEKVIVINYQGQTNGDHVKLPNSEGYRKSLRLIELAKTFGKPIVIIVDIPEFHITSSPNQQRTDEALARVQEAMLNLDTPIIAIIAGKNNSAFSFELFVADRVLAIDQAKFMIAPQKKTSHNKAKQIDAQKLLELRFIDRIIANQKNESSVSKSESWHNVIKDELQRIILLDSEKLIEQRLDKLQNRFLSLKSIISEI